MHFSKTYLILIIICLTTFSSCKNEPGEEIVPENTLEPFLNEVIQIMELNSINRLNIDWVDFKSRVFSAAGDATTIQAAEPALREALRLLGDNHSLIRLVNGNFISESEANCNSLPVSVSNVPSDIGYVRIGAYGGSVNDDDAQTYMQSIRDLMKATDGQDLKGWVVDLRGNSGGNMYPMIAAVGPILGEGTAGHFLDPDGSSSTWAYSNNASTINGQQVSIPNDTYQLINQNPKVAVLINNGVASSGEAVAISFIGRDKTKSFGSSSCGLSTANRAFNLSNGSVLILTVSYMADRDRNQFGTPVVPDQVSAAANTVSEAIEWLRRD